MVKEGVKFRLTKNKIIFFSILCGIVSSVLFYYFFIPRPIFSVNYDDVIINFRADLREAEKILVYPNEQALYLELMNPSVKNITIAFKPADEKENPYYILQILEIIPKLSIAFSKQNLNPRFNRDPLVVESYENLSGKAQNPIIALVHPVYSNETAIRIKDHVIFIKAKNYKDFDLVTVKFLMVVLGIKL